jgi:hypothetical protein
MPWSANYNNDRRKIMISNTKKNVHLILFSLLISLTNITFAADPQRPISDFISSQGTYCYVPSPPAPPACTLFVPPIQNFIGWGDADHSGFGVLRASADYAGLANAWLKSQGLDLGTKMSGVITERKLNDGRAYVDITLNTSNALIWVAQDDFATGLVLFGNRAPDVLAGKKPGLGNTLMHISFTNTAPGAPLPDLIQLFYVPEPGQQLHNYSFVANANGPLLDSTTGKVTIAQTGNIVRSNVQAAIIKIH